MISHAFNALYSAAAIVLTFGMVIFLHESGHFLVCRWLKVRVERFAFGFGPEVFGFTRGETRYSVCAVPLGGFVKPAGEDPGDGPDGAAPKPDEYFGKSWKERLLIVAAGPSMNYVLAWALFATLLFWRGMPSPSTEPVLGDVAAAYPAEKAGLKAGDRFLTVDGQPVADWKSLADTIHQSPGKALKFGIQRGEGKLDVEVTPRSDSNQGMIGIAPEMKYAKLGLFAAAKEGASQCWFWTRFTVETLASKIYKMEKPELAGPVGIMQMIGKAAHSGLDDFLALVASISVAVGFFNLLPIPLLDGGHAAMYVYEGISRRRLTARAMSVANSIGMAFLLVMLVFATYQDISRIRRPAWKTENPPAASGQPGTPASAPAAEKPGK